MKSRSQLHRLPHHTLRFLQQYLSGFSTGRFHQDRWKNLQHLNRYLAARIQPETEEGQPWLNYELISFMDRQPRGLVVEFGSGRSTVWLARQGFQVFSTEHHAGWAAQVSAWLSQMGLSHLVQLHLAEMDPVKKTCAQEYLRPFLQRGNSRPVSFILVDGIFRNECLVACADLLDAGIPIILHDADRRDYLPGIHALVQRPGIGVRTLFGPGAGTPDFTWAKIFQRVHAKGSPR